ncbi:hypothetical protein AKO1_015831, partial [Acrasis kona]
MNTNQHLLEFSSDFSSEKYKIFEISDDILKNLMENPNATLVIKGDSNKPSVLCTDDVTFSITKVETSNEVILLDKNELMGGLDCYYEVSQIIPGDLDSLFSILSKSHYPKPKKGPSEKETKPQYYTTEELLKKVQASRSEILDALHRLDAFEVEGKWRMIDPKYFDELMELLLLTISENESLVVFWDFIQKELKQYDPIALKHVLTILSEDGRVEPFHLDGQKIAIQRARSILRSGPRWQLIDFMETWTQSLTSIPDFHPHISILTKHPLCVVDDKQIKLLERRLLSFDIKTRFKQMFSVKNKWSREEIDCYIADIVKEKSDSVVDKHCRLIQSVTGAGSYYVT